MTVEHKQMENKGIATGLKQCGVPEFVFNTTLVKEGQQKLREAIQTKAFRHNGQMFGFYVFTGRESSVTKARRIFYLIAKEMYLSGTTVYCLSLSELVAAMESGDYSLHYVGADSADMTFVTDFYEDGVPIPISPTDAGRVRAWIRQKYERGQAVSLLSDQPVERCHSWWPSSFLKFLAEHILSEQV